MPVLSPKVLQPVQPSSKVPSNADDSNKKATGNQNPAVAAAAASATSTGNQPMVMHLQPPYPFGAPTAYSYGQAGEKGSFFAVFFALLIIIAA